MNDAQMTLVGNLVDDPELRFTPSGQPVAKIRVASTPRYKDSATGEWKDGDSLFLTCSVWRQAAENVAESLTRGMRVIVTGRLKQRSYETGRLKQRSYETGEGEKRTVYELEVDEVGPVAAERLGQGPEGHPHRRRPGRRGRGQLQRHAGRPAGQLTRRLQR